MRRPFRGPSMRVLVVALAIAAVLAAPTAVAVPSKLALELPDGPIAGNSTVPLKIHLSISDFMCQEARDFIVRVAAHPAGGVDATLETTEVKIRVPAYSYFASTFEGTATVELRLDTTADGKVEVTAAFEADAGPCFAPGGFGSSSARVTRAVIAPEAPEPEPAAPTPAPPPEEPAPVEPTPTKPAATEPAPPAEATPAAPAPGETSSPRCAPGKTCGAIGDYDARPAGDGQNETPGVALSLVLLATVALALMVARRR